MKNQAMWEQNSSRLSGCLGLQRSLRGAESGHSAPTWLRWSRIGPVGEVANCCPPKMTALKMALMNPAEVHGCPAVLCLDGRAGTVPVSRGSEEGFANGGHFLWSPGRMLGAWL